MIKVMCFGTFDLLHSGHLSYLRQAKKYGDLLLAVVARDENVVKIKNKAPVDNLKLRIKNLKESGLVDIVVAGNLEDKYQVIREEKPDIICLGYDQSVDLEELQKNFTGKIIKLKSYHPHIYKTSKIKTLNNYKNV